MSGLAHKQYASERWTRNGFTKDWTWVLWSNGEHTDPDDDDPDSVNWNQDANGEQDVSHINLLLWLRAAVH